MSQETFHVSTNGLGGNLGKEACPNVSIPAQSGGTSAQSVPDSRSQHLLSAVLAWGAAGGSGEGTQVVHGHEYPELKNHAG